MATRTFAASKDSIIAIRGIDGASFGAGKDYHNYVGDSGDYTIRSLIQFTLDFSNVGSINSATLYLKTPRSSDGTVNGVLRDTHGTWNSGSLKFSRVTTTWTEGTYGTDEGFNGVNSVEWDNQPSTTATGAVNFTTRTSRPSSPAVDTIVITDIVKAWAPTSVTGGGNATNYGIQIRNNTEGGSDYCEWYSLEGGASGISGAVAPYIVIDYNAAAPTVTIGSPSTPASAGIAKLVNITDTTEWSASTQLARPQLGWNYSSAASLAQSSWRVRIYSASTGGTKYYDSGLITDTAHKTDTYFEVPGTTNVPAWVSSATGYAGWSTITGLVNGTEYWWTIEVVDSSGNTSSESARYAFKVRWGQVIHVWDSGSTSSSQWDITYPAPPAGTQAAMFYRSTTTTTATTGTWYSSIGAVVSGRRYLQTMLRLSTNAGAQPTVGDITFSYLAGTVSPDSWEVDANGTLILNNSTYRFGTKSGLLTAASSAATIIQPKRDTTQYDIAVIAGQPYIFSAYVKPTPQTLLTSRTIKLRTYAASGESATLGAEIGIGSDNYTSFEQQDGWYRIFYKFTPAGSWVKPIIEFGTGTGAAVGDAIYLDGAQVEEGNVVRSWTPGFVTQAITIEGSGITVDKSGGGSLRLRGSTGGTRDVVELGANGLNFGGSSVASLYSGSASTLNVTGDLSVSTAIRAATGGADPAVYIGDDSLIFDADISDTMGIQGQQTAANGGIVFGSGKDTNLYRGGVNVLKTDDSLYVAGHTLTRVDRSGTGDNTTITTAGTYYPLTNAEIVFTPQFEGQRWLLAYTAYCSLNTTVVQYAFVRADVTANTADPATQISILGYGRSDNFGVSGRGSTVAVTKVYTVTAADMTAGTRKFKLYGTTQTTSGLVLSLSYTQMTAIPLG